MSPFIFGGHLARRSGGARIVWAMHHLQANVVRPWASSFSTIQNCPSPTCDCQDMPQGLDIDYKRTLDKTVAPYHEHVLVHTATNDWPSKIEDDDRYPLAKTLKNSLRTAMLKNNDKGMKNVLITTVSSSNLKGSSIGKNTVSLMKAGIEFELETSKADRFIESLLDGSERSQLSNARMPTTPITDVTILICGHEARDSRCGIMGPLLLEEFADKLSRKGFGVTSHAGAIQDTQSLKDQNPKYTAHLGLISHIGGHAFAGNVIIYIPSTKLFQSSPLSGLGVWYGRVEPKHVEGIIQKTILEGIVIQELRRGVV